MSFNNQSERGADWYSVDMLGRLFNLSEHFRLWEFQSHDGADIVLVHSVLVEGLEAIKATFGGAIVKINSGYRTKAHNANVGGVPSSRHLWGLAADIVVVGSTPDAVATEADNMEFGGVGRYNSFTHVDVWGENRRWDFRT